MNHLTEEQLEGILQGAPIPAHVDACPECRARLAQSRALAKRLRAAFASVQAGPDLADRIRSSLPGASAVPVAQGAAPRIISLTARRRLFSGLAAAALILLVGIPTALYMNTGSQARAAQRQLVDLHSQNLSSLDTLFVHDDPRELAGHLEDKTGHGPAMICTGSEMKVCGCCTGQFRERTVGSYVVQTPNGHVSVIVIPDAPESLGMTPDKTQQPSGRRIWRAACEGCNMALVRIGNHSYCAVGRVPQAVLERVLDMLLE